MGDGPALAQLRAAHAETLFMGRQEGDALAQCYAGADVLVFPSRTDTFGLVMIEALACGTPVAAYPVAGPIDIIRDGAGVLDHDLSRAMVTALGCARSDAAAVGRSHSWAAATGDFLKALSSLSTAPEPRSETPPVATRLAPACSQ